MSRSSWVKYSATKETAAYYYSYDSFTDVYVTVKIRLTGDAKLMSDILFLEDAVEKHMSEPGFSINIVFTGIAADDVFEIGANPDQWPNSMNWSIANFIVISHEIGHLLGGGLDDEYNRIDHCDNAYLSVYNRLLLFLYQLDHPSPPDANEGIMANPTKRFLQRHICAIIDQADNQDCIGLRKAVYPDYK